MNAAQVSSTYSLNRLMSFGKQPVKFSNVSLYQYSSVTAKNANRALSKLGQSKSIQYRQLLSEHAFSDFHSKFLMDMSDHEIVTLASVIAKRYSLQINLTTNFQSLYLAAGSYLSDYHVSMPPLPKKPKEDDYKSACFRLRNPLWLRRQLRSAQVRLIETESVNLGHVSRLTKQLYISNESLSKRQYHKRRNERLLESVVAVNEEGYEQDLQSLSDVNTSNPKIRRNELMARLKGLESHAEENKLVADFYTVTCPSRFHRYSTSVTRKYSSNSGAGNTQLSFLNTNFDLSTPRQAQEYLNKVWSKIRAELHRKGITLQGMRVAEPHHDGCPHWHILAFFPKQHRTLIRQTIRHYALQDSPDEKGAQKYRFKAIKINKRSKSGREQSAVGYICKYIAKNLSLDGVEQSITNDGQNTKDTVNRVEAWASVWGIRQFQQLGGERVTPYRELRRIRDFNIKDKSDSAFFNLWSAADTGDYASYIAECRKNSKIIIQRKYEHLKQKIFGSRHVSLTRINISTGEVGSSIFHVDRNFVDQYGNHKLAPIIGLSIDDHFIFTRIHNWTTKARRLSRASAAGLRALDLCQ